MGRAKQRMELISNEKSRYVTFQKRKKGLKKKTYELQTLCDVEVCMIVYGPNTDDRPPNPTEAEIWPQNPDVVHHLISSYRNQSVEDRSRKTLNLSDFFMDRNQKIEDELVKLRRKNDEATYSTWDDGYSDLSKEQLRELECMLEEKLQDVRGRVASMKGDRDLVSETAQNQSFLGLFGTRSMQLEAIHEQQQQPPPISLLNPWHEIDIRSHYPFEQIHQGLQIDANSLTNQVMMMPMNYNNHYMTSTNQLGSGVSSSKFLCNPVLDRQIYNYDPTMSAGMWENMICDNSPLPLGHCSTMNMETMSPYLPYLKMKNEK